MALKREDAIRSITEGIAWVAMICKYRGVIHLFDTNVISHDFWCQILNAIYDLRLQVMDRIKPNFPAIDLGDAGNKRCFQVTSEKGTDKIESTLERYVKHGLDQEFGKLQILIIGDKQGAYKALTVPSSLSFNWQEDIVDLGGLIKIIEGLETEKLQRIEAIVAKEIKPARSHDSSDLVAPRSEAIRCVFDGFQAVHVNFGTLYKLKFRVEGGDPGECCCEIFAGGDPSFAKWDETPNPLRDDQLNSFAPEMVPATFNNRVYEARPYTIPILIGVNGQLSVFSAYWFGRHAGYYNQPPLSDQSEVRIVLRGSRLTCSRIFSVKEIVSSTQVRAGDVFVTGNLVAGSGENGPGGNINVEGGTGRRGASGGNVNVSGNIEAGAGGVGKGGDISIKGGDAE